DPSEVDSLAANPASWTNVNSFNLSWSNPYDTSGIIGVYYKLDTAPTYDDDGIFILGTNIESIIDLAVLSDGIHPIYIWLVDVAGNVNYSAYISTLLYLDTSEPAIIDSQTGDDIWRNSGGTTYNVDFSDNITSSNLDFAQYRITSDTEQGGIVLKEWTNIFTNLGATEYTTDWTIDFTACQEGINYVSVRVYDNAGNIEILNDSFYVKKDTIAPTITIINPSPQEVFGLSAPNCDVTFFDINNIDYTWYQLTDGITTTGFLNWTGTIDVDDWDLMNNGTVTIIFFANDTVSNIAEKNVSIYKDSLSPIFTIYDPKSGTLFGIPSPTINMSVYDDHLESVQYRFSNGSPITDYRDWDGFIYQEDWDQIENGTVTLEFIAIDIVFNLGSASLFLRKNIYDPIIIISAPLDNELFGSVPPEITLYNSSASIDTIWYRIYNSTFSTINITWSGSINMSAWNTFGNGTLSITFYINDTLGNIGLDSVHLKKDMINPTINISSPEPYELCGMVSPDISVSYFDDNSILSISYQLQNFTSFTPFRTWIDSINSSDWDKMSNGTVNIIFRAEDIVGNIAYDNVTVRKDIICPVINITNPDNGALYGYGCPSIFFDIYEPSGLANVSYQLKNSTSSSSILPWNNSIDQGSWAKFGNGTVTILIYAIDTIGNSGNASIVVRKDIISPSIVIQSPSPYAEIGREAPFFEVYVTDGNLNSTWYEILGLGENGRDFTPPFGRIEQGLWETIWDNTTVNGTITIRFYANDTLGNENFMDLYVLKHEPTSSVKLKFISNPIGFILSVIGVAAMVPVTVTLTRSRYYKNLNKKEKSKLKKVLIAAFLALSVTVLFYVF
ncbi:MAG: hypothetical protein ACFFFT_17915, partial [Candidatus Thorarchaeota archaeon]